MRAAVAALAMVVALQSTAAAAQCTLGTQSTVIPLPSVAANVRGGWHVRISVGGGPLHSVQVDTGSRGLAVPRSTIGTDATDMGKAGTITYSSSGRVLHGEYYMTKVTLVTGASRIATVPMPVLGVDRVDCAPGYPSCTPRATVTTLGMAGVGFGRRGPATVGDIGKPASTNLFLQLEPIANGTMHPGYIIAADHIELGLTDRNMAGFSFVPLTPSTIAPGDWNGAPGCFGFPGIAPGFAACGSILVDTGLSYMILSLPAAQRPAPLASAIPNGTRISVTSPGTNAALFDYSVTTGIPPGGTAVPARARWSGSSRTAAFVNTGRDVIFTRDYAFDAGCGRIGFRPRR